MRYVVGMLILTAILPFEVKAMTDCYEKSEICTNVCEEMGKTKKCLEKCESRLDQCLHLPQSTTRKWPDPFDSSGVPSAGKGGKEHYWQGVTS